MSIAKQDRQDCSIYTENYNNVHVSVTNSQQSKQHKSALVFI